MELLGKNIVGHELLAGSGKPFRAYNPAQGSEMEPPFSGATEADVDRAMTLAGQAAPRLRALSADQVASFLNSIGQEIVAIGDSLIQRASQETGLDENRIRGERDRTVNQIRMFIDMVQDGSWVDARIDTALPDRKPLPRPDLRRMLMPLGPVVVFGASNFPLAFSVAGGDTASAFAARNPVVVKGHPAHPGTSELVAAAIRRAVEANGLPEGTFSLLQSIDPAISLALVRHPKTRAVGFTGSQRAGRALFDEAARRPDPIPVFSEMGSANPVFVLPGAVKANAAGVADGLTKSVLLGVGQFCTCPGLVFGIGSDGFDQFRQEVTGKMAQSTPATMLNAAIRKGYAENFEKLAKLPGVQAVRASREPNDQHTEGQPGVFITDFETWMRTEDLHEEIFGPATTLVPCTLPQELLDAANALDGTLTATIHGTPEELPEYAELIDILSRKAGRLIFNGFPTGVEVCHAMHHGGPYPATTDERFTSVGATAIYRWVRPVCFQNFPDSVLPPELQKTNPRNIWRTVNGKLSREAV
jgi:2,5-dioxopentanoate dehydrogenase